MIKTKEIRWSESPGYGFVLGRVRSQETFLLDKPHYDRLVGARDLGEFVNTLAETRYGSLLSPDRPIEQVFALAANENIQFCVNYAAETWLRELLLLTDGARKLKTALKEVYRRAETGRAETEKTVRELLEKMLPVVLSRPDGHRRVAEALTRAYSAEDPALIDLLIDRLSIETALFLASGKGYASGYYRLFADITNLKTALRLRLLAEPESVLEDAFLPGGDIPFKKMVRLLDAEPGRLKEILGGSLLLPLAEKGIRAVVNDADPLPIEREGRRLLLEFVNRARYVALGYEPLLRFFFLKENELTNLRLLYAAKVAGLDARYCQEVVVYGF